MIRIGEPPATEIRRDRRTTAQLLAAAERDTDQVSMFGAGTCEADTDLCIMVVKGAENIAYVKAMLVRQGLLTEGKPVDGGVRSGTDRTTSGTIGQP